MVTEEQVESFRCDGFLIIEEGLLSMAAVELLRERFAALFDGDYATGIAPDEVNWKRGRDREDATRQICNGWRADDLIAAQALSERTGRIAARLGGLPRHPHASGQLPLETARHEVARHASGRLLRRLPEPTRDDHLRVALDETFAQGGTIEYVRGSHLWPKAPPIRGSFHAPDNWLAPLDGATPDGVEPERVPVVVKAGGCAFHHSLTFHGSGRTSRRRAPSARLAFGAGGDAVSSDQADLDLLAVPAARRPLLDESFFPVLYDENGGRSSWL